MKTKKKPIVFATPLKDLVEQIKMKGELSQNDIEREIGKHLNYLSSQMTMEKKGVPTSKPLMALLEHKFQFILTGEKTIKVEQQELNNKLADQITYLLANMEVLLEQVATIQNPLNPEQRRKELTRTAKVAAGKRLRSL